MEQEAPKICLDACLERIRTDVEWIKEDFMGKQFPDFKEHYETCHKELIERMDRTNGHVADIIIWKERVMGIVFFLMATGVVGLVVNRVFSLIK